MNLTKHAACRAHQRGVPPLVIDLLLQFGAVQKAAGGASTLYLDKRSRRRIQAYAGPLWNQLKDWVDDAFAVVAPDQHVITVGHRTKRIRRH